MKKIGLIGGMSFESMITYYEQINCKINERLGGLSSAEILLSSVNFEEIEACQRKNRWGGGGTRAKFWRVTRRFCKAAGLILSSSAQTRCTGALTPCKAPLACP